MSTKPVPSIESPTRAKTATIVSLPSGTPISKLIHHYGCGPVHFSGKDDALYKHYLLFDNVIDVSASDARTRFEAFAHLVRDILSQRWVKTEKTYEQVDPKRAYYRSMEYLISRFLANNITNLMLDPIAKQTIQQKNPDWLQLLEQEPDAGLGNEGLGRLAACFLDSMATMQLLSVG